MLHRIQKNIHIGLGTFHSYVHLFFLNEKSRHKIDFSRIECRKIGEHKISDFYALPELPKMDSTQIEVMLDKADMLFNI